MPTKDILDLGSVQKTLAEVIRTAKTFANSCQHDERDALARIDRVRASFNGFADRLLLWSSVEYDSKFFSSFSFAQV